MPTIDTTHQSPNHSSRNGAPVSLLVIHATVGPAPSSISWLCSPNSRVSAHYVISKSGHVWQLVPDLLAAWHAGVSTWQGLNSATIQAQSIGIELENLTGMDGFVGQDPYPAEQIDALSILARAKIQQYRIQPSMVVRHLDIAPGRKTDPAGFPWQSWHAALFANGDPWPARWGSIATPDQTSWQWDIPQFWRANWTKFGKCLGSALYDNTNGIVIQPFEGGDIRVRAGGKPEACWRF